MAPSIFGGLSGIGEALGFKRKPKKEEILPETQQSLEDIYMLYFTYGEFYRYIKYELKMSGSALQPYTETYRVIKQELSLRLKLMKQLAIQGVENLKDVPLEELGIKGIEEV